jgi:seryl-tRNA synthetase
LEAEKSLAELQDQFKKASKSSERLKDESTAELEKSLQDIDDINRRVRINRTKWAAEAEAAALGEQVAALTEKLDAVRSERQALLESAELPLPGLSVVDGELVYQSKKWDCMSSADQLRVGVAIVRKTRPTCQFVLLDKLEQMDLKTLREFGEWLESEGLQAIATRVSTGGECSLIIEDGLVVSTAVVPPVAIPPAPVEEEGF